MAVPVPQQAQVAQGQVMQQQPQVIIQQQPHVVYVQAQPGQSSEAKDASDEQCAMTMFIVGIFVSVVGLVNLW